MKIQFLGTAAAEGVPGLFCDCDVCRYSKKIGGKNIRSRSQAIIDDQILIDFCPDTLWHMNQFGINTSDIHTCLLTHGHSDHLYMHDFLLKRPGFAHLKNPLKMLLCGSQETMHPIADMVDTSNLKGEYDVQFLSPFIPLSVSGYTITPLPAVHAPEYSPFIYMLEKNEKTFIYGTDTGFFREDVVDYLIDTKKKLNAIAMDCTLIFGDTYEYHMTFDENVKLKELLINKGICDIDTIFISHHFSHNGQASYDDLVSVASKNNIKVSYDGMVVNI